MALVSCWECNYNVSSSASSCPSCGAPPPKWKCLKCDGTGKLKRRNNVNCDRCYGKGFANIWVKDDWCGEMVQQ